MILAKSVGLLTMICWIVVGVFFLKSKNGIWVALGLLLFSISAFFLEPSMREVAWLTVFLIASFGVFVWGWINARALGIKNIMLAWTACIVIGISLNIMAGAGAAADMQNAIEAAQKAQGTTP